MPPRDLNPFPIAGALVPEEMIDREQEAGRLADLALGGHAARLVGPRRYGKTTLLRRALLDVEREGMVGALVDLEGVLSLASIVSRIERAYDRQLKGALRRTVDALLRSWQIGVSLGGGGFAATLRSNPRLDVESVLLRLLDLPATLHRRNGVRTLVAFDEFQDVLRVDGADGIIRSVVQHHGQAASYAFAGSAPSLMERLFDDPSRPLLEHAVAVELAPLPAAPTAAHLEDRFARTTRDAGTALQPLLDTARGHPQRTMLLAHQLWELVPRGSAADEEAFVEARRRALAAAERRCGPASRCCPRTSSGSRSRWRCAREGCTRRRPSPRSASSGGASTARSPRSSAAARPSARPAARS